MFLTQRFYCQSPCVVDFKHPYSNNFEEVITKDTIIHKNTLAICKNADDKQAKSTERRLLVVNDLVAAEAKYHVLCRVNFEKPVPQHQTPARPVSTEKVMTFNKACEILEENVDLYTVSELHNMMSRLENNIYTLKMTQQKLQEKYGNSMKLVTRDGKSNTILLESVADIVMEQWHNERKTYISDESERLITTAAKRLREAIKK